MTALHEFTPKSTSHLQRGHFWAIPLPDGTFGAGCVVGQSMHSGKSESRMFIAGVTAWHGQVAPCADDLAGVTVIDHAFAHIKTILESGGNILGKAHIDFASLPLQTEALSLPTWGYGVPARLASRYASRST